jgi:hypothetical protein
MGRRIPLEMTVTAIPGDHSVKNQFHIGHYIRVGILIDRYSRRCVGNKDRYNPFCKTAFIHNFIDLPIDFDKVGPGSGLYGELLHGWTPYPNRRDFEAETCRPPEKSRERLPFPCDARLK